MNNQISNKDKKDWQNFLSKKEKLQDKDYFHSKDKSTKISEIDLHGFTLDEANKTVDRFINESYEKGINKIRIVTGKGLHSQNNKDPYVSKEFGILKYSVPEYISKNTSLMKVINKFEDAKIEDGGSGAFYIYLKKKI